MRIIYLGFQGCVLKPVGRNVPVALAVCCCHANSLAAGLASCLWVLILLRSIYFSSSVLPLPIVAISAA